MEQVRSAEESHSSSNWHDQSISDVSSLLRAAGVVPETRRRAFVENSWVEVNVWRSGSGTAASSSGSGHQRGESSLQADLL
ncbi:hypothetical protein DPEC_G00319360 [Dallia pectoralis]|uniref:Uncharacterized protein n=1 Tax=Dallia pectoralis TaxID=75939 RepID=A0ACC2F9F2_DALPE|nr:hypothetical protein DPEC_G00319360 [Dallia pectoralis]